MNHLNDCELTRQEPWERDFDVCDSCDRKNDCLLETGLDIRKINGNELHGTKTGDGWEKCKHPITNDEVWLTAGERRLLKTISGEIEQCPACHDFSLMFLGRVNGNEWARCRECDVITKNREVFIA